MFNIFYFLFLCRVSLPENKISSTWNFSNEQKVLSVQTTNITLKSPISLTQEILPLDRVEARSALFSELHSYWTLPIQQHSIIAGLSVNKGIKGDGTNDVINILATKPLKIFSMSQEDTVQATLLNKLIDYDYRHRFTMTTGNDQNVLVYEETVSSFYIK